MLKLTRTDSDDPDFIALVKLLDADLSERDGDDHSFYAPFNKIDTLKQVVVAFIQEEAVSCGAIKEFAPGVMEVKRMYTRPSYRGRGLAGKVLTELENWSRELSFKRCILETGKRQPEAIKLYTKNSYTIIPNYGQYAGVENSVCFEKIL